MNSTPRQRQAFTSRLVRLGLDLPTATLAATYIEGRVGNREHNRLLISAFNWSDTREGFDFWWKVETSFLKGLK